LRRAENHLCEIESDHELKVVYGIHARRVCVWCDDKLAQCCGALDKLMSSSSVATGDLRLTVLKRDMHYNMFRIGLALEGTKN
jgi:hypothetical protein